MSRTKDIRREERLDTPVAMHPENRPEEHPDKRFRRTERALRETLLDMLGQGRIVDITTTELCRRADVSRNTFYAHYTAVEHLYDDMENDFVRALADAVEVTTAGPGCSSEQALEANLRSSAAMLEVVRKNRRLAEALVRGNVRSDFYRKLFPLLRAKLVPAFEAAGPHGVLEKLSGRVTPEGTPASYALFLYIFSGTRAVLERWIASGLVEDTQSMAELIVHFTGALVDGGARID